MSTTSHRNEAGTSRVGVLFDLDGTVLDTGELVLRSFAHAWERECGFVPSRAELLSTFGTPLRQAVRQLVDEALRAGRLPDGTDVDLASDRVYRAYVEFQDRHHDDLVTAFPGIVSTLQRLADDGVRLGLVTSKRRVLAERGLRVAGVPPLFEASIFPEDCRRHKPAPDPIRTGIRRLQLEPGAALYVGDAAVDMEAARAAGVTAVGAGWGPTPTRRLRASGAQVVVETPDDVLALLEKEAERP